jgi:ketopantoate reductase
MGELLGLHLARKGEGVSVVGRNGPALEAIQKHGIRVQ